MELLSINHNIFPENINLENDTGEYFPSVIKFKDDYRMMWVNRKKNMTDWTLTRFTTVDGSYETAIECQYDREISKDSVIDPEDTNLLISVGSPEMINKIKELPFNELKYYVDLSKVQTSYDINVLMSRQPELVGKDIDDQKVVWNGDENDKGVIPRSVCIYKQSRC